MLELIPPHRNLGCLGLVVGGKYLGDLSLPHRELWGVNWGRLVRLYWRWNGRRHWLYFPSFSHVSDRKSDE